MKGEMDKNIRHYQEKMSYAHSMEVFSRIRQEAGRAEEYLNKGLDTLSIAAEFVQIRSRYNLSVEGVFPVLESLPSYRNLGTTELLLGELVTGLNTRFRTLQRYISESESFRKNIDSLVTDTSIYQLPSVQDSVLFQDYFRELAQISREINPVDTLINNTLRHLRQLEQEGADLRRDLQVSIKLCSQYRFELGQRLTHRELPFLFAKQLPGKALKTTLASSFRKSEQLFYYYLRNNTGLLMLSLLLFIGSAILLTLLRNKIRLEEPGTEELPGQVLLKHPVLSALFLTLTISQFFFPWPPFVFYGTGWLLAVLTGTIIYFHSWRHSGRSGWLMILFVFLVLYLDNLILYYSPVERYFLAGAALFLLTGSFQVYRKNKQSPGSRFIVSGLSGLLALLSLVSLLSNITGHYNLSKQLLLAGFFGVISGILLYYSGKMINDWMNLASSTIEKSQTRLSLRFRKTESHPPRWMIWLLAGGWLLLFFRNFYFYELLTDKVRDILISERSIGNFHYTWSSVLVFIAVLIASVLLARFIALFSSTDHIQPGTPKTGKKGGFNNWLLLIRITVITAGILLAFASAGIPMDKITIIIGSLGVGIGLGLQSIVGNLFSGIILAFERPFEIGDQIEVDNQRGRVKEMGFRSSRIITFEGSEVIIPNGDLLSHHVINYTLSNNYTRVELVVGVKYGSDLEKIKTILEEMLRQNEHIRNYPAPQVLLHTFNESSIDFRLLFWTDINMWVELKSEIILAVAKAFREAGVDIPFPQLDVHIIASPGEEKKKGV